jgi:regulator of protease activity HflC (stomatin/prohibitin superfamily)
MDANLSEECTVMAGPPSSELVSRPLVGLLAVICVAIAGGVWIVDPERTAVIGAFGRVGLVLVALWFALPTASGPMGWRIAAPLVVMFAIVIGLAKNSRVLVILIPLLLAIGLLATLFRPKQGPGARPRRRM